MTQQPFSPPSKSEYTLGKDLNLLPFELFNHVKAGRLHPLDKDTGQPIPRPDAQRTKDRHKKNIDDVKAMSLKGGKIDALYRGQEKEEEKRKLDSLAKKLKKEHDVIVKELETMTDINSWTTYDPPEEPKHLITHLPMDLMKAFDILQNACFHKNEIIKLGLNVETRLPAQKKPGSVPPKSPAPIDEIVIRTEQNNQAKDKPIPPVANLFFGPVTFTGQNLTPAESAQAPLTPSKEAKELIADQNKSLSEIPAEPAAPTKENKSAVELVKSFQDYITQAKENKTPNELIAVDLKEKYSLTYLEIARALQLNSDLQPQQFDAAKQRARRLIIKGEAMKAKSVTP